MDSLGLIFRHGKIFVFSAALRLSLWLARFLSSEYLGLFGQGNVAGA
jgi:hypothetical protein